MTVTFYDEWSVTVIDINADFSQRFIIADSDNSDGIYLGAPGTTIARVSGQPWSLTVEWNDNASSGWNPSRIRRSATYSVQEGLVVILAVDDSLPPGDGDYDDMILICRSLSPLMPLLPSGNPYDFSIKDEMLVPTGESPESSEPD